jgi:multidrug efflux pump subunit AcrA (membrane-fusion protein)
VDRSAFKVCDFLHEVSNRGYNRIMRRRRAQSTVRWILVISVVVTVLTAAGVVGLRFLRPLIVVTEAVEGPVVQAFYSTGTVQPLREYPIKSNVPGVIVEVKVDKGSAVKKGDVLAMVSQPELQFAVDQAQAEVAEKLARADVKTSPVLQEFTTKIAAAQEIFEIAQREQKRVSQTVAGNAASQADLDRALERLKQSWGELESLKSAVQTKTLELQKDLDVAKAALATAKSNLDQQTLRSPIDGVVLDRPATVGTRMAINDQLMRVADVTPGSLVMRAAVDEEDIAKVRAGQLVRMTLYAFPGRALSGEVVRVYDQADADRRTFEVDVKLAEMGSKLQPGMTGELAFVVAEKARAVVVPSQAVQDGAVFVIEDNQARKRDVQIGIKSIERTEIISGLRPGERIAISPITNYREPHRIRTSYTDPIAAAGLNKPPPINDTFKGFQ